MKETTELIQKNAEEIQQANEKIQSSYTEFNEILSKRVSIEHKNHTLSTTMNDTVLETLYKLKDVFFILCWLLN